MPTDGLTPEQVAALVLVALGAQAPDTARVLSAVARPAPPRPRPGPARRNGAAPVAAVRTGTVPVGARPGPAARAGTGPDPSAAGGGRAVPVPPPQQIGRAHV